MEASDTALRLDAWQFLCTVLFYQDCLLLLAFLKLPGLLSILGELLQQVDCVRYRPGVTHACRLSVILLAFAVRHISLRILQISIL